MKRFNLTEKLKTPKKIRMQKKVSKVMKEFGRGKLSSSSGKKVTNREQAVAIALNTARKLKEQYLGEDSGKKKKKRKTKY